MFFPKKSQAGGKHSGTGEKAGFYCHYVSGLLPGYNILCDCWYEQKRGDFYLNFWLTERRLLFYNEWHAMFWHSLFCRPQLSRQLLW